MNKIKEMTGQTFYFLKVVKYSHLNEHKQAIWDCQCVCGNELKVSRINLRAGNTKSCGCKSKDLLIESKTKGIGGQKFGWLTAIRLLPERHETAKSYQWECKCDCGKVCVKTQSYLKHGTRTSCGCQKWIDPKREPGQVAINRIFDSYEHSTRKTGREFNLTKEQISTLVTANCFYCGTPPLVSTRGKRQMTHDLLRNGIDRVDSAKGYTLDNVVACCKTCNFMKKDLTQGRFLFQIRKIVEYRASVDEVP
jgi:hypothetical protein